MDNRSNTIGEDIDSKNAILNKVYAIGMAVFAVVTASCNSCKMKRIYG